MAALAATGLVAAFALTTVTSVAATRLYVAVNGRAANTDTSCATARYAQIEGAIRAAAPGASVVVCAGTYRGQVTVIKPITLVSEHATIDATHAANGILIPASGATVEGFTVRGAIGEGILVVGKPAVPVSGVTVKDNVVEANDQGAAMKPTYGHYRECKPSKGVPGDCGEGIHLMVAVRSTVSRNRVVGNAGGILLTDEFGPTDHNRIVRNTVTGNVFDCGITLASHSPKGYAKGTPAPAAGGVYDNTIARNLTNGNGTKGQGAGILLATALPGGAVYGNTVADNTMSGNGLAGVTVHAHTPGEDLNGNVITGNRIGTNNVDGDRDFSPHIDMAKTAIIVATTASPVAITVSHNHLADDGYGLWHTGPVTVSGWASNSLTDVKTASGTS
ncbi:MAG: right-handed parallel beta-helix repeat-containing protein [Trebonia sp.]